MGRLKFGVFRPFGGRRLFRISGSYLAASATLKFIFWRAGGIKHAVRLHLEHVAGVQLVAWVDHLWGVRLAMHEQTA